jgi:hypothetical protein
MCSIRPPAVQQADVSALIRRIIDELTAAAADGTRVDPDFSEQLASAWAVIAAADPELARRAARYTDHPG